MAASLSITPIEGVLETLVTKAEAGATMSEDRSWRAAQELKSLVAKSSSVGEIRVALDAVERLQVTRTPYSHNLQLQILDGFDLWLMINSMNPKARKKLFSDHGTTIADHEFTLACELFSHKFAELVTNSLSSPRGSKKAQKLRARILEMFQPLFFLEKGRELFDVAVAVLSSPKSGEHDQAAALSIIGAYYECHKREKPDKTLVSKMKKLAKNAPTDRVAFGATEALVKCRVIGDFGALALRDEWKDKFVYGERP